MIMRTAVSLAVIAVAFVPGAAAIQQVKSLYTVIDLGACKAAKASAGGEVHVCDGLPGYPVYIAADGKKFYLSVGADAATRQAARQSLAAANTLFEPGIKRTTVEWRFVIREDKPVPYATIVRYFTGGPGRHGEVLVVMRVTGNEACHIAYVDALANPDAMILARAAADDVRIKSVVCPARPVVLGVTGKSPL